jgi:hypothetical protein
MDDVGSEKLGSWSDSCNAEKLELEGSSCFMCHDVPPADWLAGFEGKKGKRSAETPDRGSRYHVVLRCILSISARLEARNSTVTHHYYGDERYPKILTCIMHGLQGWRIARLQ